MMMWRAPAAFAGLVLLALPVLVHLLSRRPARMLAFPSLRFLVASTLTATRRTRINDLPLLLVRLAIVAAAVIALAQPSAPEVTSGAGTVVMVVDSATVGVDTAWSADSTRGSADASARRVVLGELPAATEAAVGWLRTQPAPRRLVLRSAFVGGAFDSSDVAALPSDIAVSFEPRTRVARVAGDAASRDSIVWMTALSDRDVATVRAAMSNGGAPSVRVERGEGIPAHARTVVSTRSAPRAQLRPLSAVPVTAALAVRDDAALRGVLETVSDGNRASETTRIDSLTLVLFADRAGRPLLTAQSVASAGGATGDSAALTWFSIVSHDSSSARVDVAAALLTALTASDAPAATAPTMIAEQLQRLAGAPVGAPIGAARADVDVHDTPTWARWVWLVVLGLLVVEWWMRRVGGAGVGDARMQTGRAAPRGQP